MGTRLYNLQIGRFIAAISVVLLHLTYGLHTNFGFSSDVVMHIGTFGVYLFFVISGFIIFHIESKYKKNSTAFLIQRIARVIPLYYIATIVLFAFVIIAPDLVNSTEARTDYLFKSLLFIPFSRDGGVKPLLFLGWTLNYEIYFYLMAYISLKFTGTVLNSAYPILILVIIGLGVETDSVIFNFYANPVVINFLFGMALSVLYRDHAGKFALISYPLLIIGVISFFFLDTIVPHAPAILKLGVPAAVIAGGILGLDIKKNVITAPFISLGDASYSMYIIHPYILQALTKIVLLIFGATMTGSSIYVVVSLFFIILVSILSYLFFEKPSGRIVSSLLTRLISNRAEPRPRR